MHDDMRQALRLTQARARPTVWQPLPRRAASGLMWFTGLCLLARASIVLTRFSSYEIGQYLFADDAFYYLRIAQNVVRGRGSTFDGVYATNGYHPLWELCCTALQALWPSAGVHMVSVVYTLQVALLLSAVVLLERGLSRLHPYAAALASSLLALGTIASFVLVDGMESGLAFTLLAGLVYLAATRAERFFDLRSRRYAFGVGALLLLLSLSRLEAGLFAALFLVGALWRSRLKQGLQLRRTLWLAVALAVCAALYIGVNLALVGLPVPISGLVKALWPSTPHQVARIAASELGWFVSPLRLQRLLERPVFTALLAILLGSGLASLTRETLRLRYHGVPMVIAGCLLLAVYNIAFTRQAFYWYGWPELMLGALACFGLLRSGLQALPSKHAALAIAVSFGLAMAYGLGTSYRWASREFDELYDWSTAPAVMDSALRFIRTSLPPDAKLAGDSVGMLSYVADRDIMNVEGLVADRAYYEALEHGHGGRVLRERGVDWLFATRSARAYTPACASRQRWDFRAPTYKGRSWPQNRVTIEHLDFAGCGVQPQAAR